MPLLQMGVLATGQGPARGWILFKSEPHGGYGTRKLCAWRLMLRRLGVGLGLGNRGSEELSNLPKVMLWQSEGLRREEGGAGGREPPIQRLGGPLLQRPSYLCIPPPPSPIPKASWLALRGSSQVGEGHLTSSPLSCGWYAQVGRPEVIAQSYCGM